MLHLFSFKDDWDVPGILTLNKHKAKFFIPTSMLTTYLFEINIFSVLSLLSNCSPIFDIFLILHVLRASIPVSYSSVRDTEIMYIVFYHKIFYILFYGMYLLCCIIMSFLSSHWDNLVLNIGLVSE